MNEGSSWSCACCQLHCKLHICILYYADSNVSSTGGTNLNAGQISVSNSGYVNPSIITLDSPSPPVTLTPTPPVTQPAPVQSFGIRMPPPPAYCNPMYMPTLPTFLDLDSDSNSPQSNNPTANPLYPPHY